MLIDTHCHIHEPYDLALSDVLARAHEQTVDTIICVGTSEESSIHAVEFAQNHGEAFAAVGVHPHNTEHINRDSLDVIQQLAANHSRNKVIAVGEVGLDYFYSHSPKEAQISALRSHIDIALAHDLPIIFHVRNAFDDFWPIFDNYPGIKGVLHSFTDSLENLEKALARGLYIGVNGISTFTKDEAQTSMFDAIPLNRILFETDAPFLTPSPHRGKVNEPAYVKIVAEFHANRRGISFDEIASHSTHNAHQLFHIAYV